MSRVARAKQVFNEALDLPEGERAAFVARECAGDAALRAEVEALLKVLSEGEAFLSSPTAHDAAPTAEYDSHGSRTVQSDSVAERAREIEEREAALRERPGTRIGPYRLLQEIGEGGFGSVFMAEQDKPVQRKVALKIIKLGMDTRQVVARFEQERQALALMDHPHIAKVLDAGSTETGRPYFVMELVKGRPITTFCDEQRLSIEDRLSLFAQVCAAVQHAHTKGVIHRDIKPSNVLVNVQDGRPYAKVIDFGIAKATASKLTEKTLFTQHSQIIGTPEYMSPEQAHGSLDIDTRTDVYSLGVLLYELLTGTTPFSGTELKSAAYDEIRRIIREVDPPAPSTRLSKESQTIASVAAMRQSEPRRLNGQVRGELDWIVMKALEKDRQRRYESASGLAADVARFLSGAPVDAAPPSAAYRAKKFVRRHRASVAAGAAVAAALVLGLAAFAWQYRVAADQRDIAVYARAQEASQRLRAEENGKRAEEEAARALAEADRARKAEASERDRARQLKDVADFQAGMLKDIDATRAGEELMRDLRARFGASVGAAGGDEAEHARRTDAFARDLLNVNATDAAVEIIDRTILKPALGVIGEKFKDQPLVDATLRGTLAQSYLKLGRFDDAIELQRGATDTRRRVLGDTHADTLYSVHDLAVALDHAGRLPEAEKYYREAFEGRRATLGENDGATLNSMANLANLLRTLGRFDEAEPMLRHAVESERLVLGPEDRSTLVAINQLGYLLVERGDLAGTEPLWREAYETGRRVFGDDDRDVLVWRANLGGLLQSQGRLKEAEPLFRESVESFRRVKGEDHPETIRSISALAGHLVKAGRYSEAEPLIRDAVDKSRRVLGPDHEYTVDSVLTLANTLMQMGKARDAEPYLREVLASRTRMLGPDHPNVFEARAFLAKMLAAQDRLAESEAMYRAVAADYERVLGPDHKDTLIVRVNLGNTLVREKKFDEAEPILRGVVESDRRVLGPDHPETIVALANLGSLFEKREQYSEAEISYRECLERFERVLGPDHPYTLSSLGRLAATIRSQGRGADAEPIYRRAIEGAVKKEGKDSARAAAARCGLGMALTSQGKYAEAEKELLEAERVLLTSDAGGRTRVSIEPLTELYEAWDRAEPGKGYGAKAQEWRRKLQAPGDSSAGTPASSK